MANRSDINSVLPRRLKRMVALMGIHGGWNPEREGAVRRKFIEAHAHAKRVHRGALKLVVDTDSPQDTESASPATT